MSDRASIILKKDLNGKWYFSIEAVNGRILAHSQSYSSCSAATKGARAVTGLYRIVKKVD